MRRTWWAALLGLVVTCTARADEFADQNARAVRENPEGVTLRLTSPKARYRVGERIPVELAFAEAGEAKRWLVDVICDGPRIESVGYGVDEVRVRVSPAEGWADPLQLAVDAFAGGGFMGATEGPAPLDGCRRELDLNEWVRFDRPGTYRVEVAVDWVEDEQGAGTTTTSTLLELEVVGADAASDQATITRALKAFRRPKELEPGEDESDEVWAARREGLRALAFLATPEAVAALLRLAPERGLEDDRYAGLIGARDRRATVAAIESGVEAPDVYFDNGVFHVLDMLTAPAEPPPLVYDHDTEWTDAMQAAYEDRELRLLEQEVREERRHRALVDRLTAALPGKHEGPFAAACEVLAHDAFDSVNGVVRWSFPPATRDLVVARFLALPPQAQLLLLTAWPALRAPVWLDPLKAMVTAPADPEGDAWTPWGLALRCLAELDPAWAEAYVRREWLDRDPATRPNLRPTVLLHLPPGAVKLDDAFVKLLLGDGYLHEVIERHGTPDLLPRVQAVARRSPTWPLLRFCIRHDRASGLALTYEQHRTIPREVVDGIEWGDDVEALLLEGLAEERSTSRREALEVLVERCGQQRVVEWWAALDGPRREWLLHELLALPLGDEALARVAASLRTAGERGAFRFFERKRAKLRELGE